MRDKVAKLGMKVYVIEKLEVSEYTISSSTKKNFTYINKEGTLSYLFSYDREWYLSRIMALGELEERLVKALKNTREQLRNHRIKFNETKTLKEFKKSFLNLSIEEIEAEITTTTLEELENEEDKSIHRKI